MHPKSFRNGKKAANAEERISKATEACRFADSHEHRTAKVTHRRWVLSSNLGHPHLQRAKVHSRETTAPIRKSEIFTGDRRTKHR
jgi:hypothetical protein